MTRPLVLLLSLLIASPALADVVHLANGRRIQGQIVSEGDGVLVIKTLIGKLTIPAKQVARIERESLGRLYLGQARQASKDGDRAKALRLYAKAAASKDLAASKAASKERKELEAAPVRHRPGSVGTSKTSAPRWDGKGDPFDMPETEAYFRELEEAARADRRLRGSVLSELYKRGRRRNDTGEFRLAASDFRRAGRYADDAKTRGDLRQSEYWCRLRAASRALRRGDAPLAYAAAQAVAVDTQTPAAMRARANFLHGRGAELTNRVDEARRAFSLALSPLKLPRDRDLATLRELARLASFGIKLNDRSPGVGEGWRWVRTQHFAILHQIEHDTRLGPQFEGYRKSVIERLKLRGRLDEQGRIAVFIFPDRNSYRASPGARGWSAGHAQRLRSGDDLIRGIYLYAGQDLPQVARHEMAHILMGDAMDDALLPAWIREGGAVYAEPESSRQRWLALARRGRKQLDPISKAIGRMLPPMTEDASAAGRFYVQAALNFRVLADRIGIDKTLQSGLRVNTEGPERALRSVGLRLDTLEGWVERLLDGK